MKKTNEILLDIDENGYIEMVEDNNNAPEKASQLDEILRHAIFNKKIDVDDLIRWLKKTKKLIP